MINENDYNVPMITIDDFCLNFIHYNTEEEGSPLYTLSDMSKQRKVAIMWIEKVKLAVIMGRLPSISVQIPERKSDIFKRPWLQTGQLLDCQAHDHAGINLKQWQRDASSEVDFTELDSPACWVDDNQLYMQYVLLKLLYHIIKFYLAVS